MGQTSCEFEIAQTGSGQLEKRGGNAKRNLIFGYRFGYRHQFGLFTETFAKLLTGRHLWISNITLGFAYLSSTYGILERLKIVLDTL
jgi:hypothetical protein